jgi:hypothetical protein
MAGVPKTYAPEAPTSIHFAESTAIIQVVFAGPEWQLVSRIGGDAVASVEDADPLSQARQLTFSGPLDSPPPTDPPLME